MSDAFSAHLHSLAPVLPRTAFNPYQEEAIVALALDHPEFFMGAARFLKPDMFGQPLVKWIMVHILNYYEEYGQIPTRQILHGILNDQNWEEYIDDVVKIVDRKSNPRETPAVKDTLLKWSKDRAFGLLYSDEAIEAYHRRDYGHLEQIFNDANRIVDVGTNCFSFFDHMELLFQPDVIKHKTTGFSRLDRLLNNGGPSAKEVVCWLAGTNVGKSIMLCNNAIASLKGEGSDGRDGQDVLLVTFELDTIKTAIRCLASAIGIPTNELVEHQDHIRRTMEQMKKTYNRRFLIYELPPDECSVNHIHAIIETLRNTENWKPEVVILDYMDLMVSRNDAYNKDDYTRQKHVANEIRGLAKKENVLVFTATQTNRSGASGEEIVDLTKAAESFGKQFSLDYVISLNQTQAQRIATPPRLGLFVAKNRNGPKHEMISCEINYNTMVVRELL
jgi:replicative DNA helicase